MAQFLMPEPWRGFDHAAYRIDGQPLRGESVSSVRFTVYDQCAATQDGQVLRRLER